MVTYQKLGSEIKNEFITDYFTDLLYIKNPLETSLYDLVWVLCTDFFSSEDKDIFLQKILTSQNRNGTWGDGRYLPHSVITDTLSVMMFLNHMNYFPPRINDISNHLDLLIKETASYKYHDTVAFEFIAPLLFEHLEKNGIPIEISIESKQILDDLYKKASKKMQILKQIGGGIFDKHNTVSFTAEIAALIDIEEKEVDEIYKSILPNGSIALSPAATAGAIITLKKFKKDVPTEFYNYLHLCFDSYKKEGFPSLHPLHHTLWLWNSLPWLVDGNMGELLKDSSFLKLIKQFFDSIEPDDKGRVSWDVNNFSIPDLDDTSVSLALYSILKKNNIEADNKNITFDSLKYFQREDGSFFCYPFELHPSPAAIMHALMALDSGIDTFGNEFLQKYKHLHDSLINQLNPNGRELDELSHDKWHGTWTYGAQRWLSIKSIYNNYQKDVDKFIEEILLRQTDGGWGQKEPTVEESSYIISGLVKILTAEYSELNSTQEKKILKSLKNAEKFFISEVTKEEVHIPRIWISKNVYAPYWLNSAIINAKYNFQKVL